jgi:hypothetical protein
MPLTPNPSPQRGEGSKTRDMTMRRLLRRLRTPNGRLVLLLALLASAWVGWTYWPPRPLTHWERPSPLVTWSLPCPDGTCFGAAELNPTQGGLETNTLRLWRLATGRDLATVPLHGSAWLNPRFAPDGSWLAAQDAHGVITVLATADGRVRFTAPPAEGRVLPVPRPFALSPDGRVLACPAREAWPPGVELRDLAGGQEIATLERAGSPLLFSPDGRTLLTGYSGGAFDADRRRFADEALRLWDAATGREVGRLGELAMARPGAVAFSPDVRRVAAGLPASFAVPHGESPYPVTVWDVPTRRQLATLAVSLGNDSQFTASDRYRLEFSPDGRRLVVRGPGTGLFWDLAADPPRRLDHLLPKAVETFVKPYESAEEYPVFDPTGARFVARRLDEPLTVYDAATLAPVASCRPASYVTRRPVFSADGRRLAVATRPPVPAWEVWLNKALRRPWPLQDTLDGDPVRDGVQVFDATTGAALALFPFGWDVLGFGPDGRTVWAYGQRDDPKTKENVLEVQQWAMPPSGPPAWLWALTAAVVALAVTDRVRSRRMATPIT